MPGMGSRNARFLESEEARDIRILTDYSYPDAELHKQKVIDTIVMFGSARIRQAEYFDSQIHELKGKEGQEKEILRLKKARKLSQFYEDARNLAGLITLWGKEVSAGTDEKRLLVCTGGGPGIMEAGNRGAREVGGKSVALNIQLPFEQVPNPYADEELSFEFNYFFIRKLWFIHLAKAVVVFPGGFGTVDELFETLTLLQTRKTKTLIPVFLYGSNFWKRLVNFDMFTEFGLISDEDLDLFHFVDSPEETMVLLKEKVNL
ncbi:MAG: LOG family protein [Leptospiraceae bacterium]|nr:LOG family protein [Leptospiraceae bacterium]